MEDDGQAAHSSWAVKEDACVGHVERGLKDRKEGPREAVREFSAKRTANAKPLTWHIDLFPPRRLLGVMLLEESNIMSEKGDFLPSSQPIPILGTSQVFQDCLGQGKLFQAVKPRGVPKARYSESINTVSNTVWGRKRTKDVVGARQEGSRAGEAEACPHTPK